MTLRIASNDALTAFITVIIDYLGFRLCRILSKDDAGNLG